MKIIVSNPAEPNDLKRFIARFEYIWGEGVNIVAHRQPMIAAELRVLAAALVTAADGLERDVAPETVRHRIESMCAPVAESQVDNAVEQDMPPVLILEQSPTKRTVRIGDRRFLLLCLDKDSRFGRYHWNCTDLQQSEGRGGFSWTREEGFEHATRVAREMVREQKFDPEAPQSPAVPEDVIDGLLVARETGDTNMLDRAAVLDVLEDQNFHSAVEWIANNPTRFVEALNLMGKRVGK